MKTLAHEYFIDMKGQVRIDAIENCKEDTFFIDEEQLIIVLPKEDIVIKKYDRLRIDNKVERFTIKEFVDQLKKDE